MKEIINKSKNWVEKMVIAHQLCPFAKLPFERGLVHFEVTKESKIEKQLLAFWALIEKLENTRPEIISNALLIFPTGVNDFMDYMNLYYLAEDLLFDQNKNEQFQLASFHPQYQFDGVDENDVTNYTNRSPFPMIHILRIKEVAEAIASHPNIDLVPENNKNKLKEMGEEGIRRIMDEI